MRGISPLLRTVGPQPFHRRSTPGEQLGSGPSLRSLAPARRARPAHWPDRRPSTRADAGKLRCRHNPLGLIHAAPRHVGPPMTHTNDRPRLRSSLTIGALACSGDGTRSKTGLQGVGAKIIRTSPGGPHCCVESTDPDPKSLPACCGPGSHRSACSREQCRASGPTSTPFRRVHRRNESCPDPAPLIAP